MRTLAQLGDSPRWSNDGKFAYFNTQYFSTKGTQGVYLAGMLPAMLSHA